MVGLFVISRRLLGAKSMAGSALRTLCRHCDRLLPTWVWPVLCVVTAVLRAAARARWIGPTLETLMVLVSAPMFLLVGLGLAMDLTPVWTAVVRLLCRISGIESDA